MATLAVLRDGDDEEELIGNDRKAAEAAADASRVERSGPTASQSTTAAASAR